MAPRPVPSCSYCDAPFADVGRTGCYCVPCKAASYCGAECQRKHRDVHKPLCKAEAKRRFEISLAFAEKSSPMAMFYVGMMYASGYGVAKNPVEAIRWSRRAAEKRHPEATYNLATYLRAVGGPDNVAEAGVWMRRAADLGLPQAQVSVARRHMHGGPEEDMPMAAMWFKRAADKGHRFAARMLANAYFNGYGVTKDPNETLRLLRVAGAEPGDRDGSWALATMLLSGYGTGTERENLDEATHQIHRAAFLGSQPAQCMLGREYAAQPPGPPSKLVPVDLPQALAWYRAAAAGPPGAEQTEALAAIARLEAAGVVAMPLRL